MMENNKGELTTQQIVMLIILITSFVVILFLLFKLNLGEITDKEICHNSVVLKGKGKGIVGKLDCKTSYVCISGEGKCDGFNPTITIDVDMNPKPTEYKTKDDLIKDEIMKTIADEMADCWWMFGEGKIDYVEIGVHYHCAICSIVKFDEKIQEKFSEVSYLEFYNYLSETKKDNTQTYLFHLYDVSDLDSFKENILKQSGIDIANDKISTKERFSIVTGAVYKVGDKDDFLPSYFVESDKIVIQSTTSSLVNPTNCNVFDLTKA